MVNKLRGIFIHRIIQNLAASMIAVFIPIYLLDMGFEISTVFLFLFVQWSVFAILSPAAAKIISYSGIRKMLLLRIPVFLASLYALLMLGPGSSMTALSLVAFMQGLSSVMHIIPLSALFASVLNPNHEGAETSWFISLPQIGGIIGPILGALILTQSGFIVLFGTVSVFLVMSVFPLLMYKGFDKPSYNHGKCMSIFKKNHKMSFSLGCYGVEGFVFFIVFPVVIYVFHSGVLVLGIVLSAMNALKILMSGYVGKMIDEHGDRRAVRYIAMASAVLLLICGIFSRSQILIYLSIISGLVSFLIAVPFEAYLYRHARTQPLEFMVYKELSLYAGRLPFFLLLILFASQFDKSFFIGALSALLIALFF